MRRRPVSMSTLALMPARSIAHVLAGIESDADRHALHDLDPVAAGVLRRQDRELRAGAGADRGDRAVEGMSGKVSTVIVDLLADAQIGDVGFLRLASTQGACRRSG